MPIAKAVIDATVWTGVPPAGTETLPRLNPVVFAGTHAIAKASPATLSAHVFSGVSQNLPQLLLQLVGTKAT
ncbi:MAG TPA: hypothetical protein PKW28_16590, partial [Turneriella sp.]|nr:hypothetical protein [Turneriella sp.]